MDVTFERSLTCSSSSTRPMARPRPPTPSRSPWIWRRTRALGWPSCPSHIVHPGGKGLSPPITEVEQPHGAEHLAEAATATARAAGIDARAYVATGDPAKEIIQIAEEIGADLIVVGSRGFGAVRGVLFGSVSRAIVGRSKIPVTVVTQRSVREPAHV